MKSYLKKPKYTLPFLLLLMVTVLHSCKERVYKNVLIYQVKKDWGAFKEGTWWVYEEENSKIRDSVYVYKQEVRYINVPEGGDVEEITTSTASSLGIDSMTRHLFAQGGGVLYIRDYFERTGFRAGQRCFILPNLPPEQGDFMRTAGPSQITRFDSIFPTYTLGTLQFNNVVRGKNNYNTAYYGYPTNIYSAKHIGIIRKEFPDNNIVWNLVKYHIVQ